MFAVLCGAFDMELLPHDSTAACSGTQPDNPSTSTQWRLTACLYLNMAYEAKSADTIVPLTQKATY
jgi:hypothetical protein